MNDTRIAVVVPYYQRAPGLLTAALRSAFSQTIADRIFVLVVDDGSPSPAMIELENLRDLPQDQIKLVTRPNGGAGAARNAALDIVPGGTEFVAFLDSDDCWRPRHLETALGAMSRGYDAYFADFYPVNDRERTNFERIPSFDPTHCRCLDEVDRVYELDVTPIEHIVKDGGGVIQTSTVVYRYARYPQMRFREQFYNGQDFFFWMDLGQLGAKFVFSRNVDCENGEGINIYQASGWDSERSLQRLRNELFVWTSVEKIYPLSPSLKNANRRTIRNLQQGVVRDIIHRLRRARPISIPLLKDIVRLDPAILALAPLVPFKMLRERFRPREG